MCLASHGDAQHHMYEILICSAAKFLHLDLKFSIHIAREQQLLPACKPVQYHKFALTLSLCFLHCQD